MKSGDLLISEKRKSQIKKGFDYKHDSGHNPMQFINAARAYMYRDIYQWPFDRPSFKLDGDVENLTNAGAMIAAAIDLTQRYEVGKEYQSGTCMQPGTFRVTKIKVNKSHVAIHFVGTSGDLKPDKQIFMLGSNFDLYATPIIG